MDELTGIKTREGLADSVSWLLRNDAVPDREAVVLCRALIDVHDEHARLVAERDALRSRIADEDARFADGRR